MFGANQDNTLETGLLFINKKNVLKTNWDPGTSGEYARWISRYGSVTVNFVGYQMAWAGMNEAGLMISTMSLAETQEPTPDERPPFPGALWMQYQLDNHSTIEQVIASDTEIRLDNSAVDHYLVCDRTGTCAVIEFLDGEMVTYTGSSLPVQALTNSTYQDSLTALEDGLYWKVKVFGVDPTGPAAEAGIQKGDWIIAVDGVGLDGEQSLETFYTLIDGHKAGDEMKFTVIHPGETEPVTIVFEMAPLPEDLSKYSIPPDVPVQILSLGLMPQYPGDFLTRFVTASKRLEAFEPSDSDEAVAYAFDTLKVVSREDTVWSFIFDPVNLRVHFRTNHNPNIRYVDLSSLDFSCNTPAKLLDVHTNLSGDISDEFITYTHTASFAYSNNFFSQYEGVKLSPFLVDTLLWGLDSFPCQDGDVSTQVDIARYRPLIPPTVTWAGLTILHRAGPFWIPIVVLSLAFIVWRNALGQPSSPAIRLVWALVTIILGPFGLLAYFFAQRKKWQTCCKKGV
jgi:penicillin V acylase-like amidase (Ntn superfamily)